MRACSKYPSFHGPIIALSVTLLSAGCSDGHRDSAASNNGAAVAFSPAHNAATPNKVAPPPGPQAMATKIDGFEFSYKWPAAASAIPPLNDWLRGNGQKLLADNRAEAMEAKAEAKKDGYPFNGSSYEEEYATVADTPRILALLSDGYVYTGGAHGMPISTAILWDKAARKRLSTGALIDIPRFAAASRKRFCTALDEQRAEKRGAPVRHDDPDEVSEFNQCVDMTKQLILPISSGGARGGAALDNVRVVIGPYEAGPYAEGSYIIDLPMDASLLATVKPAYRDAFAIAR